MGGKRWKNIENNTLHHNTTHTDQLKAVGRVGTRTRTAQQGDRTIVLTRVGGDSSRRRMGDRGGVTFGKLMMSQFRSQTKAGKNKTLLHEASKIVGSGHVEVPKWFEPLSK